MDEFLYGGDDAARAYDDAKERREQRLFDDINDMTIRYIDNKRAQIGATIECAGCKRKIVKKSYQTQFCSNKGASNCKDRYWNLVPGKRRHRAQKCSLSHST
jgi:hypothetical protein